MEIIGVQIAQSLAAALAAAALLLLSLSVLVRVTRAWTDRTVRPVRVRQDRSPARYQGDVAGYRPSSAGLLAPAPTRAPPTFSAVQRTDPLQQRRRPLSE